MKHTFDYYAAPQLSLNLYGEKAYDILKAMYTSSILDEADVYTTQLFRIKGKEKLRALSLKLTDNLNFYPMVGPDGSAGIVRREFTSFRDYLTGFFKGFLMADVKKFKKALSSHGDKETVFVFSAEGKEIELTLDDFNCFFKLLENNGSLPASAKKKFGEKRIEAFVGKPLNLLEAECNRTRLKETTEALRAAFDEYVKKRNSSGGEVTCSRGAYLVCCSKIIGIYKKAAESFGDVPEEKLVKTISAGLKAIY